MFLNHLPNLSQFEQVFTQSRFVQCFASEGLDDSHQFTCSINKTEVTITFDIGVNRVGFSITLGLPKGEEVITVFTSEQGSRRATARWSYKLGELSMKDIDEKIANYLSRNKAPLHPNLTDLCPKVTPSVEKTLTTTPRVRKGLGVRDFTN